MSPPALDVSAYLERIGVAVPPSGPTIEALHVLHTAHVEAIPFENLDQRLGRPVGIDLASLQDKLVVRCRGGYCFEQNTLFAAVLSSFGFDVDTLEARVRPEGATAILPRTHMTLRVSIDGRQWLADVGFGGNGPYLPVPLDGEISDESGRQCRVVPDSDGVTVLQGTNTDGAWRDLYAFRGEPALPVDFELAHYYTATHPNSRFRQTLTVQRTTRDDRYILRDRTYERLGTVNETRTDLSDDEVHTLVTEIFLLPVSLEEIRTALDE